MQKLTIPLFLCAASAAWAQTEDWSANNHIAIQGQYVFMHRNKLSHHVLVEENGANVLSSKQILNEFQFTPGYRVSLGYVPSDKVTCELIYLDLKEWEAHHTVTGPDDLNFPFKNPLFTIDYNNAFEAKGRYKSHYQEAEANFWVHLTPRRGDYFSGSWLFGFRYMNLKERFNLKFFNDETPLTSIFIPSNARKSSYDIETKNRMGALQLGVDLQLNPTRHWNWDASVKVGPMLNYTTIKSFLGDFDNTIVIYDFEKEVCKMGFVVEPSITLTYQFGAHFNIHVGYQMTFVSGLALAGDQFDKSSIPDRKDINLNGDMIIQGGFAGIGIGF